MVGFKLKEQRHMCQLTVIRYINSKLHDNGHEAADLNTPSRWVRYKLPQAAGKCQMITSHWCFNSGDSTHPQHTHTSDLSESVEAVD